MLLTAQHSRHQISEAHLERLLRYIDPDNPDILTVGFARRFATYKRATLLTKDLDKFRAIISDSEHPIVFIFAGKAHPADVPGQNLLKELYKLSGEPEFIGKLLIVQGYDLSLGRRLVSGVDVWLNNPIYPLGSQWHLWYESGNQCWFKPQRTSMVGGQKVMMGKMVGVSNLLLMVIIIQTYAIMKMPVPYMKP
jgi:hypothetical protein